MRRPDANHGEGACLSPGGRRYLPFGDWASLRVGPLVSETRTWKRQETEKTKES